MSVQSIPPAATSVALAASSDGSNSIARQNAADRPTVSARAAALGMPETARTSTPDQIDQALDEVRKAIAPVARDLRFSVDDDTGRTIIKVIDSSTDEVIKQIPSEEILAIAKAIDKLQGLLVRQEV